VPPTRAGFLDRSAQSALHPAGRAIRRLLVAAGLALPSATFAQQPAAPPPAADQSTLELAKKTQNPIADLISLPLQNNLNFGYGAKDAPERSSAQYVLNVQPVVPIKVTDGLNLITRPIIPVIRQPDLIDGGETWGLADIQLQTYLSPSGGRKVTWGIGPVLQVPSATNGKKLGTQKWSAGPGLVALTQPGKWVIGGLVNNLWSFAGDSDREDVNLMTMQPFVNYNFPKGWYVAAAPIITANWEADDDDTWTVPLGGGFGRIMKFGKQPVNLQAQAFYNVVKPDDAPTADWTLRLQVQFLFPK
jgi:hypothetical protein